MKLGNVGCVMGGMAITIVGLELFNIALTPFDWFSPLLILGGGIMLCFGISSIQLGFTGNSFLGVQRKTEQRRVK